MLKSKDKTGPGDLHELDDITDELNKRLNDRGAGDLKLNYAAETIALAIREQTLTLERVLRDRS